MDVKNMKILLVDDEVMLRDLYEHAFRMVGYNIETAVDGQDAVDKLEKMNEPPLLILLDIKMPRMSGFDVLRYLRNSEKFKDMMVIMLTNLADEVVIANTTKLGALGYLIKQDYEPRQIVEKVEEMVSKYKN